MGFLIANPPMQGAVRGFDERSPCIREKVAAERLISFGLALYIIWVANQSSPP